ncbi:MAG TPA: hypothetical protein VIW24_27925 [Aldersonia sp.]
MTHTLSAATVRVCTLTVDAPSASGIATSVHASEDDAIAHLRSKFDPEGDFADSENVVQSFCDNGFVVYIEEHTIEILVTSANEGEHHAR